uniref:Phospholipid scramblase n=1 Tax=Sphenodon punctatus TaxID=8508 RepID=A0A8D0GHU9_SPHPU
MESNTPAPGPTDPVTGPRNPPTAMGYQPINQQPGYQSGYPAGFPGQQAPFGYPQNAYGPMFQGAPVKGNISFQGYPAGVTLGPGIQLLQNPLNAPSVVEWMEAPLSLPNCPPGLEYLSQVDQILIHQQIEVMEAITGWEMNNKYQIKNSLGQMVYFAAEEGDFIALQRGACRPFTIKIFNSAGQAVMAIQKSDKCTCFCCLCCCASCMEELEIQAPLGTSIGHITRNYHPCVPKFTVQNEKKMDVLKIAGPCCPYSCGSDVNFEVLSVDGTPVGRICRQWTGWMRESYTDADNFGIQFPLDLDVKMKALIMGACFLLDFMFYERSANRNPRNTRR